MHKNAPKEYYIYTSEYEIDNNIKERCLKYLVSSAKPIELGIHPTENEGIPAAAEMQIPPSATNKWCQEIHYALFGGVSGASTDSADGMDNNENTDFNREMG